jgi:hypothetical protein
MWMPLMWWHARWSIQRLSPVYFYSLFILKDICDTQNIDMMEFSRHCCIKMWELHCNRAMSSVNNCGKLFKQDGEIG